MSIDAPYNFVPLADWIHLPDWGGRASHDLPFKDGISGEIPFTLTAHTPLLIGRERREGQTGEVHFFQAPDGRYAIPGSSLRGLLRAVTEIVGFGRMRMVDERRYSVRDLTQAARSFYGQHMTEGSGREGPFRAKPQAGWLSHREGQWHITPCQYARVEHDDLATVTGDDWWRKVPRDSAQSKYRRWQRNTQRSLEIQFTPESERQHRHSGGKKLVYRKAIQLQSGTTQGTLVFTGQPAPRDPTKNGRKHLEFIFYDRASEPLPISADTFRDFRVAHESSAEWQHWQHQPEVPVFYLANNGRVQSLGLALMYRLTYQHTVHELINNTQPGHLDPPGLHHGYDLADLLFGAIDPDHQPSALKGRVSVGTAFAPKGTRPCKSVTTILNGPKPSYYPNYIRQQAGNDGELSGKRPAYRTFGDNHAQLRGFKRYPARPNAQPQRPTREQTAKVQTRLHPLPSETDFAGTIQFHNLLPVELGALLWVLTWGRQPQLRHSLGMGKPFGYGQVAFDANELSHGSLRNNLDLQQQPLSKERIVEFIGKFEQHMETAKPGWRDTPQLRELLAMADPQQQPAHGELRHMTLDSKRRINQFQDAKKKKLALAWYTGTGDIPVDGQHPEPIRQPFIDPPDTIEATPPGADKAHTPTTVTTTQEIWEDAHLTLDAGRGQLFASKGQQKTAGLNKDQLWDQFNQDQQALLGNKKKKRTIKGIAVMVERSGNQILLKGLAAAEAATAT